MLAGSCLEGAQTQLLGICPLEIIEIDTVSELPAVKAATPVLRRRRVDQFQQQDDSLLPGYVMRFISSRC